MKKKRAKRHLAHNQRQDITSKNYKKTGLITKQAQLKDWKYGLASASYNGCGWIAIVNAMALLGSPVPPEEVVYYLESRPFLRGTSFWGLLGTYPWSVAGYFKSRGYQVKFGIRSKKQHTVAAAAPVSVVFYGRPKGGHFVTIAPTHDKRAGVSLYRIYNDRFGDLEDIRPLESLWKENKAWIHLVIGIFPPNHGV